MPSLLMEHNDIKVEPAGVLESGLRPTHSLAQDGQNSARCRTNSRRGMTDPNAYSYPPVEAVCRALEVLRAVNKLRIARINGIFKETGIPKSTIVRMLETLMAEGYVARDNMCGGYRVTHHVSELAKGYEGISQIIEASRPLAIDLTRRIKWPIGLGVIDGDAIAIQFSTGAISPWSHTNTVLGLRPDLQTSAMGRAYLAFCSEEEREMHIARFRTEPHRNFDKDQESRFRRLLERAQVNKYTIRDPQTKPYRTTTIGMPIMERGEVQALISISFFKTAIGLHDITERIIEPLRSTAHEIEDTVAFLNSDQLAEVLHTERLEPGF